MQKRTKDNKREKLNEQRKGKAKLERQIGKRGEIEKKGMKTKRWKEGMKKEKEDIYSGTRGQENSRWKDS